MKKITGVVVMGIINAILIYAIISNYGKVIKKEKTKNDLLQAEIYSIQNSTNAFSVRIINLTEKEKREIEKKYEFRIEIMKDTIEKLQTRLDDFERIRTNVFQENTTSYLRYLRIKDKPKENIGKSCLPF